MIDATCGHCGIKYRGRPNSLYCSKRCRKLAQKARSRLRWLETRRQRETQLLRLAVVSNDLRAEWDHRLRLERIEAELSTKAPPKSAPTSAPEQGSEHQALLANVG